MNHARKIQLHPAALASVIALALVASPVAAQHAGHAMPKPVKPTQPAKPAQTTPVPKAKPKAATPAKAPPTAGAQAVDHAAMGHEAPNPPQPSASQAVVDAHGPGEQGAHMDHSGMDHAQMAEDPPEESAVDHDAMDHVPLDHSAMGHSGMDHSGMDHGGMAGALASPREPIPVVTDADRRAAFPDVAGHAVHDTAVHSYWLLDRLEAWDADEGTGLAWEAQAWIGTDLNRLWLRSEGERVGGHTEAAELEVLYGRSISRWWDLVAGGRHDFRPADAQSYAAIGVMGLAPQKFEVEATAYVGERGQTAARFEVEYELLLTNRLILQPLVEVEFHGKDDPARGIGSGLGTVEAGLRLRYHLRREFAPYIGLVRERAFGKTARYRRLDGEDIDETRFVAGLRIWF
ncbi:copper resistance protein B [Luteimonas vadosa]|uniref:Copper resistance protein B n=1 Tax=Luteimonas vadosa TaxID=1165507 RepID=A0ABP9E4S8_9GAMM